MTSVNAMPWQQHRQHHLDNETQLDILFQSHVCIINAIYFTSKLYEFNLLIHSFLKLLILTIEIRFLLSV